MHSVFAPSFLLRSAALVVALHAGSTALAAGADLPLVKGGKNVITTLDVEADAEQRIPPDSRAQVLSRSSAVTQIVGNLYARRAMADKAEAEGLAKDPEVAAAVRMARDKALSDAWLAKLDAAHTPSDAIAEPLARNIYQAKPERFKTAEQVQIRHILIGGTEAESRAQAEKTLEELKAGADFAQMARDRSTDKRSGAKGGDLGFFERGRMLPEFEAIAFSLQKPGDLSEIVKTQYGYHILQLQDRKPVSTKPFAEVREELMNEVRNNVRQEARAAEAQKLQQDMTLDAPAISKFAADHATQLKPIN
ncbi:peptidyl-prolyl cis-trans isomerase C [Paracidovorax valerianellae]|uniref:peptidylprolyl isomerase n=2 Tax=Paracidovorax valerianellae TaxID=187868 RepID=A0A1G7BJ61_9BURK|nr:peptidyl-prolyl cis-trans isomerase C [Paracidovorax valerianellae]